MPKTSKKHQDPGVYQADLLMLLPDTEQLADYVVRPHSWKWQECLAELLVCDYFGFDIETWGDLYEWGLNPWKGNIRLIQTALPSGRVIVVDLGGREGYPGDDPEMVENFLDVLGVKLESKTTKVIGHNLKFDCLWMLVKYGIQSRCLRDTMVLSQIYWAGVRVYRHNLKAVAERMGLGEVDKTQQKSDFSAVIKNEQLNYAAKDALLVIQIFSKLGSMIKQEGLMGTALAECAALPAWVMIEHRGMPVCKKTLDETLAAYKAVEAEAIAPWYTEFPHVNPGSPKQLISAVKEKYDITLEATDQNALLHHPDKPALQALLNWRTLLTYINYLEALKDNYFDGAVRSHYSQLGPMGTRSNSSKPNLQNPPRHGTIPKDLRHHNLPPLRGVFRASEDHNMLIADLSQAHARLATVISRDKLLIEIYRNQSDMHCITAEGLAKVQGLGGEWTAKNIGKWRKGKDIPEGWDKEATTDQAALLRQVAKPTFYGKLNAAGGATIQRTAKTDAGIDMTLEEAKDAAKAWDVTYSGLRRYQLNQCAAANRENHKFKGHTYGSIRGISGRRIYLRKWPNDFKENEPDSVKLADACACTWAGDEKTVMALAMGEQGFLGDIDSHPEWGAWIANNCHDELDVVVRSEYAEEAAAALQNKMQAAMDVMIKGLIPVDEPGADHKSLIAHSWADK